MLTILLDSSYERLATLSEDSRTLCASLSNKATMHLPGPASIDE